jgi:hypothetical protein
LLIRKELLLVSVEHFDDQCQPPQGCQRSESTLNQPELRGVFCVANERLCQLIAPGLWSGAIGRLAQARHEEAENRARKRTS